MNILYSIPVHECPECVKQMCEGILYFDETAIIVIHVSKSRNIDDFKVFDNRNIIINPTQYDTNWGWDFAKIHVSNYLYVKENFNFDISYVIFLASNSLMIKNPKNYIKDYDAGFSEYSPGKKITPPLLTEEYQLSWGGNFINSEKFLNILSEIGNDKKYGCIIDGCYVTKYIMEKICYFYNKHFQKDEDLKFVHSPEEKIFPTIACNLTEKISDSLIFFERNLDLRQIDQSIINEKIFFIKDVPRSITNEIREYYRKVLLNGE